MLMKKFTFLLSIPLLAILAILFLLMVADDSNSFKQRNVVIGIDEHCSEDANYIHCAIENLYILRMFVYGHQREPYPDYQAIQNDKGGCDLDFLRGFSYKDKMDDKRWRTNYIEYCSNWYAKHAVEILLGENYTNKQAAQLYAWNTSGDYNFTNAIDIDRKNKFIEYMNLSGDSLVTLCQKTGREWGFLSPNNCNGLIEEFSEPSRFSFETRAFSMWVFLLGLAPLLILTGLIYFAFDKWSPILSNATVSWMDNKKQFRIYLVGVMTWTSLCLISSILIYDTVNPFDDAWFLVTAGLYPLLIFLITYFIVSAEDKENAGS